MTLLQKRCRVTSRNIVDDATEGLWLRLRWVLWDLSAHLCVDADVYLLRCLDPPLIEAGTQLDGLAYVRLALFAECGVPGGQI